MKKIICGILIVAIIASFFTFTTSGASKANYKRLFFMICVNTENGIKYRMVIGLVSRKAAYCP